MAAPSFPSPLSVCKDMNPHETKTDHAIVKFNIDAVIEQLVNKIPVPVRDFTASPHMIVIRSFDVNKPGAEIDELKGGVAGGSILTGVLKLGDEIEIRPGIVSKDDDGKIQCKPIFSRVV